MSKFGDEIEKALNDTDDVPEGMERCEDCGGLHPIAEFGKFDGDILMSQAEIEAGKFGLSFDELSRGAHQAWDDCDPDRMQTLAQMHKMFGATMGISARELSAHLLLDAMASSLAPIIREWREKNPHHTREELIDAVREFTTRIHYNFQTLGENIARMMIQNPPRIK